MKPVLITGDQGYIGTELKSHLNYRRIPYVGIDKENGMRVENICYDNMDLNSFSYIIHLAAVSGIKACELNKKEAIKSNIIGSFAIFNLSQWTGIPVIFASTQAVKNPTNFYGLSKFIAEIYADEMNKKGADIRVLRFSNVYGGDEYFNKKNTVISRFIRDDPIIVNGSGEQERNFIHVLDICSAIMKACIYKFDEPIDICSQHDTISINHLASLMNKNIIHNPESTSIGILNSTSNPVRATEILSFISKHSLNDYIGNINKVR